MHSDQATLRRPLLSWLAAGCLAVSAFGCPRHTKTSGTPGATNELKKFSALTAKSKERKGFFDTYQKGDDLFIAVPKARLGEKFLLHTRIAQGVGVAGLLSGMAADGRDGAIVSLERHGERLYLLQHPTRIHSPASSMLRASVAQSYAPSVVQSATIESERADGALVVNGKGWFLSDPSDITSRVAALGRSPRPAVVGSPSSVSMNKERSYIDGVKGFSDNVNVRARLTFTLPERASVPSVPDERYLSLTVTYVLARLPQQPMEPRLDDDRIGYFTTTQYDPGSRTQDAYVRTINRWRLSPSRPLTYYIDGSVPTEYRRFVETGVQAWGRAFAAAGWPQAIRVEPLPKGADPEDIRYPTIRWDSSVDAPLGRGESLIDPRSGEILGASILISSHLIRHHQRVHLPLVVDRMPASAWGRMLWTHTLRQPAFIDRPASEFRGDLDPPALRPDIDLGDDGLHFSLNLRSQAILLRSALIASGSVLSQEATPERILGQSIVFCAMHEVGHTLGLRHNFKSSSAVPNDRLADMAWVRQHGLTASVMDYPGLNLPHGKAPPDWLYYPGDLGDSDLLTIVFGYSPDPAQARAAARQAASRGHVLGTDEDAHAADSLDPLTQTWDLGADPLAWARDRAELIQTLLQTLPSRVLVDDASYGELTEVVMGLLSEYGSAVDIALRYVGGQQLVRDHVGDAGGRAPYSLVAKQKQREAVDFLTRYVFDPSALSLSPSVLTQLGPRPISGFNGRRLHVEVPISGLISSLQESMLAGLLSGETLGRLRQSEYKFGPDATWTLPEVLDYLTQSVWNEVLSAGAPPKNIVAARRELQRLYVERLAQLAAPRDRVSEGGADLRSLARFQLLELRRRLQEREKASASLDSYTRAHLADVASRMTKVLDAAVIERSP